jgi:pyruvate formate lyase activating enzyme
MVFDLQRFSVHDGPGIRTNVFLKGCPLRCPWCANPESQRLHPELMLSAQHCIRCGQFPDACVDHWGENGWTQAAHDTYAPRTSACPTCAVRVVGKRRSAGEVIAEVLRDQPFYAHEGGMTLTGGEPTFQPRFAEALLRVAKAHGLNTTIETTGHTRWKIIERLLPFLDHVLYDLKHIDADKHKAMTGVDNELILLNLQRLLELHAPVTIRIPVIPGFNADDLPQIAAWLAQQDSIQNQNTICLLPYHTFGRAKYTALGRAYPWDDAPLSEAAAQHAVAIFQEAGLTTRIGG